MNEHAIENGVLKHFSVSQIKTFLLCPAKWAGEKLFQYPRRDGPATKHGRSEHKKMQHYYQGGPTPDIDAVVAALDVLPLTGVAEVLLEDPTLYVEGVKFTGNSDLLVSPERDGIPEVWDWKFVKSFDWVEDPATSLQLLVYGHWTCVYFDVPAVRLNLAYFRKGTSDFKIRRATVTREQCAEEWLNVVAPVVRYMKAIIASTPAFLDVERNAPFACKAYGGCPYLAKCDLALPTVHPFLEAFDREV